MGCSEDHPLGQRPEDRRRADAIIDQAIDELTPMVASKGACETVGGCPVVRRTSVVASVSSFWHQAVTRPVEEVWFTDGGGLERGSRL